MADIEKRSAAYSAARVIVKLLVEGYFDKIVVTGGENIPTDKPVIIAPNHQNGLPDPLLFVIWKNLQPVWLARGDIFNKITSPILRFFKILPVYRMRDGVSALGKNEDIFKTGSRILRNNRIFGLFPEAAHSPKRQLLSIKKGVPRVILQTFEDSDFDCDIQIVPAGIYYDNYYNINHDVVINIGKPIAAMKYAELLKENKFEGNKAIREDIRTALEQLAMHIPSKDNYMLYENLRETLRKPIAEKAGISLYNPHTRFSLDKVLIEKLDKVETSEKPKDKKLFERIKAKNEKYRELLEKHNLRDENIILDRKKRPKLLPLLIALILTFPIFVFGGITHYIPFRVPDKIIRKKIKDPQLWMTFNLVLAILLFPLLWLTLGIVASFFFSGIYLMAVIALIILSGDWALKWYKNFKRIKALYKAEKLRKKSPEVFAAKADLTAEAMNIFE